MSGSTKEFWVSSARVFNYGLLRRERERERAICRYIYIYVYIYMYAIYPCVLCLLILRHSVALACFKDDGGFDRSCRPQALKP